MTSSPWDYFIFLFWRGYLMALICYIFVWGLTHWKRYVDWV